MKTYGVIMAGGGGTRFWPLSRKAKPKQFLNLSGKDTMVMDTAKRLCRVAEKEDIFIVTGENFVATTINETAHILRADHILGEPAARNTAACIGYAAMEIVKKYEDGVMCIVPSDHFIRNEVEFERVMKLAVSLAEEKNALVTIGIKPTFPSTGYGYIRCEEKSSDNGDTQESECCTQESECCTQESEREYYQVEEFVEKPDLEHAAQYLASGQYAWNSGMFVWKASLILEYFKELLPDIYAHLSTIGDAMGTSREKEVISNVYPTIPKISIDYGIMERAKGVLMVEGDFGWNDVGSFDALEEIYEKDENGNVVLSNSCLIDTNNCILYGNNDKLIATLGVKDLIVARTDDIILVCDKKRAQDIKLFSETLPKKNQEDFC